MNDDELEQAMRDGLERRAAGADVTVPIAERVRDARRRRRGSWVAIGLAAASVVAAGAVGVVVTQTGDDAGRTPVADPATSSDTSTDPGTTRWRTEYWRDMAVDVPADWGLGTAPLQDGLVCGDLPTRPYVGRPILASDMCVADDGGPDTPEAPYVWLGVDLEPGTVDLGGGYTRETVIVNGSTLSVATADPELRHRIIASATGSELCLSELEGVPTPQYENTVEGTGDMVSAHLCAYRLGDDGVLGLVYAEELDPQVASRTFEAVDGAPAAADDCPPGPFEIVVVHASYADPYGPQDKGVLEQDLVYELDCGVVGARKPHSPDVEYHEVTEATVPWATPEFQHLLTGPPTPWSYDRFIGMQG